MPALTITKLVRETVEANMIGDGDFSVGAWVDEHILNALTTGANVFSVSLEFNSDEQEAMKRAMYMRNEPMADLAEPDDGGNLPLAQRGKPTKRWHK